MLSPKYQKLWLVSTQYCTRRPSLYYQTKIEGIQLLQENTKREWHGCWGEALEGEATEPSKEAWATASEAVELAKAKRRSKAPYQPGSPVKDIKIKSLQIYLFSLTIKETGIIECFIIWDYNLQGCTGIKYPKELTTAIHGAIILAKLSTDPSGEATRGIILARASPLQADWPCSWLCAGALQPSAAKKMLMVAGFENCYTFARSCTLGNFTKATFDVICKDYSQPLERDHIHQVSPSGI